MRFSQLALLLVAILVTPAAAQQNPVTAHYRAYRTALERGDLATADAEATSALETAQLDPHSAGSVAALAMNVALVRLSEGHRAGALAPAQLAASLAANPQSHVDPLAVDIAVKRAALQLGDQSEAALLGALNTAQTHGGLDEYVFDGAADLGGWAAQQGHLAVALAAWQLASHASPGESDAAILSRAHALVEVGAVMFRIETRPDRSSTPTRSLALPLQSGMRDVSFQTNADIYTVLGEAVRITRPLANRPSPDGSLTRAQLLYSRAYAFYLAQWSRLRSSNVDLSSFRHEFGTVALPTNPGAQLCNVQPVAQPRPSFPTREQSTERVGAVVVRFVIDATGHVTDARVVATVGGDAFERSVAAVLSQWTVSKAEDSPPNCEMAMTRFSAVSFLFD